ncbi:MAG: hypothetical protein P8I31_04335, partial [Bacteroidia bacterium]|nr:hypothetical protein [Bacteroidia bacterium]
SCKLENNPEQPEPKEKHPPAKGEHPLPIGLQPPNDGEQPPPDIGTDLVFLDKHPDLEDAGIEVSSCKVLFICDLFNELDSFKPFPFSEFFLSGEQPLFNLFVKELLADKSSFLLLKKLQPFLFERNPKLEALGSSNRESGTIPR